MINFLLALFLFCSQQAFAEKFSFDNDLQEWANWGTGLGSHDSQVGHNKKGSLWLSSDWGEVQTFHYHWNKLSPGIYKVTAWVRAQDVQAHPDGSSFWHFFDGGKGTENVFLNLHGSYDWRKVEYTLKVLKNDLSIWFRLKSPGQVWIDDLTLSPVSAPLPVVSIASASVLKRSLSPDKIVKLPFSELTLIDFDQKNRAHPFSSVANSNAQKMGQFSSRKYYNLDPSEFLKGNWSQYDRIELDVFNGEREFVEFYLTLGDESSRNYWSQLNHKTHLAPGWNHLNFSLDQFLGERGSHRFFRALNRKEIRKFFIVVDPNEAKPQSSNYFVDNIKLSRSPAPVPMKGVYAFDFTSHKDSQKSGFRRVTSQNLYDPDLGFGFVNPRFWRVEDSQWAANSLRYTIGVLGGHFKVKLPNGKYRMQLIIDRLGFWDPSFWKDRTIYLNGTPVFKESRSYANEFLKDLLQFEKTVPKIEDHPYDLYLKKIFNPLEFSFSVVNGELDMEFEGDPTGISLNSLVIWNLENKNNGLTFVSENEKRSKLEFDWMARSVNLGFRPLVKNPPLASVIEPSLTLGPSDALPSLSNGMNLQGGNGERVYGIVQLRGSGRINWKISGSQVLKENLEVFEIIPQYISPDLNHETYMIAGKYLNKMPRPEITMAPGATKFLLFSIDVKMTMGPGIQNADLIFISDKVETKIPVRLNVVPYDLPLIDFPVGFFGPDPIPFTYFKDHGLEKIRKEYRHEAIKLLGNAGFTTFTGLPAVKLITDDDIWSLDTRDADEMMTAANRAGMSKVYFSYGGKFPQEFLDGSLIPSGISEQVFFKKVSPLLKKYLDRKGMPLVVHTFSDEAGGYSDKIAEDVAHAKKIKSVFPFLKLGGFSSPSEKASTELRSFFDYGFFSNFSRQQLRETGTKKQWGTYNASPGNLDDPRFTFGPGLFYSRLNGLTHYLEWHSSSVSNFPYYDLDGRESDVTMFQPTSDGRLLPTLRFILANEGLNSFRKLKVLDEAIRSRKGSSEARAAAKKWLQTISSGSFSSRDNILRPGQNFNFRLFCTELDHHLSRLLTL